mmetsp:Transcript_85279/g.241804  ORF Transcript_85279/g.241804 Transcript_85279/m.241804 type:complete len:230 (-) Transcript_85279:2770-3459(-)
MVLSLAWTAMACARKSLRRICCLLSSESSPRRCSTDFMTSWHRDIIQERCDSLRRVRSNASTSSRLQVSRTSGAIRMKGMQFLTTALFIGSSDLQRRCFTRSFAKPSRDFTTSFRHFLNTRTLRGPNPGMNMARGERCTDLRTVLMGTPTFARVSIRGTSRAWPRRSCGIALCSRWRWSLKRPFSSAFSCHSWQVSARGFWRKRARLIACRCSGISQSRYTPSFMRRGW